MNTKKLIIRCFCIAAIQMSMAAPAFAQKNAIDLILQELTVDERFTQVTISGKMFELMTSIDPETPEERAMLDAVSNLDGLKILACSSCKDEEDLFDEVHYAVRRSDKRKYEVLLEVRNEKEKETFFVYDEGGEVRELLLIGYAGKEFFLISLTGVIDLAQIANIGRALEVEGLNRLESLDKQ